MRTLVITQNVTIDGAAQIVDPCVEAPYSSDRVEELRRLRERSRWNVVLAGNIRLAQSLVEDWLVASGVTTLASVPGTESA